MSKSWCGRLKQLCGKISASPMGTALQNSSYKCYRALLACLAVCFVLLGPVLLGFPALFEVRGRKDSIDVCPPCPTHTKAASRMHRRHRCRKHQCVSPLLAVSLLPPYFFLPKPQQKAIRRGRKLARVPILTQLFRVPMQVATHPVSAICCLLFGTCNLASLARVRSEGEGELTGFVWSMGEAGAVLAVLYWIGMAMALQVISSFFRFRRKTQQAISWAVGKACAASAGPWRTQFAGFVQAWIGVAVLVARAEGHSRMDCACCMWSTFFAGNILGAMRGHGRGGNVRRLAAALFYFFSLFVRIRRKNLLKSMLQRRVHTEKRYWNVSSPIQQINTHPVLSCDVTMIALFLS